MTDISSALRAKYGDAVDSMTATELQDSVKQILREADSTRERKAIVRQAAMLDVEARFGRLAYSKLTEDEIRTLVDDKQIDQ